MISKKKIKWMDDWCAKHGLVLSLDGVVGFGRECVGVMCDENGSYPDYAWWDDESPYQRLDKNGDVWCPKDAYHKHSCVAVLGHGPKSINQLYRWLWWFDKNCFEFEIVDTGKNDEIEILLGQNKHARLVRKEYGDDHK